MRVVFLEDVAGVAHGGDVKEVKNGFARNYLIPQALATPATNEALQRTRRLGREAETKRLKTLADMKELSQELDGSQVTVEMKAGASGRLYGSVTNMIVADEVAKLTDREIDRRTIQIPESIRQVGVYQIRIKLHPEVETDISVLVHPSGTDPAEFLASLSEEEEVDAESTEDAAETDTADVSPEPVVEEAATDEAADDTVDVEDNAEATEAVEEDASESEEQGDSA
ncbi:MAG: 50S ribosomal protein L9 [SAR202 cluster bacterium]|nr:50S ribosomal protein L9 [SAR202 cluster bacterium]